METKRCFELTDKADLSSPRRLQDPLIKLEAMSPGKLKTAGASLKIGYGIHETPFGQCLIATTPRGVCHLQFLDGIDQKEAEDHLGTDWVNAEILHDQQTTQAISDQVFPPFKTSSSPLVLHIKGTNFQLQVWRTLLKIPFAGITTYQRLAQMMGRPTAARAVGNAIGGNPVGYIIPCHRVIRESGEIGGYRWGRDRKAMILDWEASQN